MIKSPRMSTSSALPAIACVVVAALALTGCSESDAPTRPTESESASPSPGPEAGLREAVEAQIQALNEGDTLGLLFYTSGRCRALTTTEDRREMVRLFRRFHGDVSVLSVEVTDMNAAATRAYASPDTDDELWDASSKGAWWVLEDGTWRHDGCDAAPEAD